METTHTDEIEFTTPAGITVLVKVRPSCSPSNMTGSFWVAEVKDSGKSALIPVGKYAELDSQVTAAIASNKRHAHAKNAEVVAFDRINNEGCDGYNQKWHG